MFLKVKRVADKQYFALCESVRRDKKIKTKTILSLGNADKALSTLRSYYPEFLDRYYEIVGTKKCRDNLFYGLYKDNEFLCVYYSGLHYGLPFMYNSFDAAEEERKKYINADFYEVKEMPYEIVLNYKVEIERRLEML